MAVAAFFEEILDGGFEAFSVAVNDGGICDGAAPVVEGRVIECWIPVLVLPGIEAACNGLSEIVVVCDVWKTPNTLQLCSRSWIFQADQNIVDHIGDLLCIFDTLLVSVDTNRLKVRPIIPDSFDHTI